MNLDIKKLREDLIDYYEGAYFAGGFGAAMMDSIDIKYMDEYTLIEKAKEASLDLNDYIKNNKC